MEKEALFAPRLARDEVELPGLGTVTVRGLSRLEAMHVQAAADDVAEADRRVIAQGMVDPELVVPGLLHSIDARPCPACADVKRWQEAAPADELEPVTDRIAALSGLAPSADKEAYKSVRGGPDPGAGVLPGRPAEDDGGPAALDDAQ